MIDRDLSVGRKLHKGANVASPSVLLVVLRTMLVRSMVVRSMVVRSMVVLYSSCYPYRGAFQSLGWYIVTTMVMKTSVPWVVVRSCS